MVAVTALITPDTVAAGWLECEREGRTRQFAPLVSVTRVLRLNSAEQQQGQPVPAGLQAMTVSREHVDYMIGLGLSSIDIVMDGKPAYTPGFGPSARGVYRLEIANAADQRCDQYNDAVTGMRAISLEYEKVDFAPAGHCLTLTRVDESMSAYSHFVVSYGDEAATRVGYFHRGTELRSKDGEVVARAMIYAFEPPRQPTCPANSNAKPLPQFLLELTGRPN